MRTQIKLLYRSPIKTGLTVLLLSVTAFLLLYNLSEYCVFWHAYQTIKEKYQGVLTVEASTIPDNSAIFDYFLVTDETYPGNKFNLYYEDYHQQSISEELIDEISSLPHISRTEKRYLTAGVSPDYVRLDTDLNSFPYFARCILTATVKYRYLSSLNAMRNVHEQYDTLEFVTLEDVKVLAGDPAWLKGYSEQTVYLQIDKENLRGKYVIDADNDYSIRLCMFTMDNRLFPGDADVLQPGRRYVLVLRNNCLDQPIAPMRGYESVYPKGYVHRFAVGDDSLIGWWPYFTDITDLPEDWLESDDFADLRELIKVTNDDVHTFDVVYGDDMASQRRAADGRIVCDEGRFITPADAGQPVCVVNAELLDTYGLVVGDSITLNLGNYLSEQYAPLGAVAVTRGRQSTDYSPQSFTIIGAWRDLNEGKRAFKDRFWSWSNNAIFVPSAFLPDCVNAEHHEFKPGEVSFIVGDAAKIDAFKKECLPKVEELGVRYSFSDMGWSQIGKDLIASRSIAFIKLVLFAGAAIFAIVLTVWLFIGRKKKEYGILRALGMRNTSAMAYLYLPCLLLGLVSALLGLGCAVPFILQQTAVHEAVHPDVLIEMLLWGCIGFLFLLTVTTFMALMLLQRKSVLELLVEGKS